MLAALAFHLAVVTVKAPAAPITVETCKFVKSASYNRGVRIVFKNTGKATAKLVIFEVVHGSYNTALVDEGNFTPGETIDHVMTSAPLTLWRGENPDRCVVTHVHFTNGTTWP